VKEVVVARASYGSSLRQRSTPSQNAVAARAFSSRSQSRARRDAQLLVNTDPDVSTLIAEQAFSRSSSSEETIGRDERLESRGNTGALVDSHPGGLIGRAVVVAKTLVVYSLVCAAASFVFLMLAFKRLARVCSIVHAAHNSIIPRARRRRAPPQDSSSITISIRRVPLSNDLKDAVDVSAYSTTLLP